jgi:NAD(P)H-dependent flavin oxidoreductase YrpB (nitropropane dioxygenase family)
MRTPLCDLLGIDVPIVQAPIGPASVPALAAAVSEVGALGTIALSWTKPEDVAGLADDVRARTAKPFHANILLEWPAEGRLEAALEAGVRIVSLAWGDPGPYVGRAHAAEAIVIGTAGTAEEATRFAEAGVDVVCAQGWEAGGHVWGQVATMALVPAVVDAVAPVPVIAAGGIADGRGIAAALALGAQGAWIGTRFLLAEEAPVHPDYRRRLLTARAEDAVYAADLFDVGWENAPHRALRNSTRERWEAAGAPSPGARPGEGETVARRADGTPIVRYSSAMPVAGIEGDVESLSMWSGQGIGLADRVQPAAEIVRGLVDEADAVLTELAGRS